jgi:hypothetical protein
MISFTIAQRRGLPKAAKKAAAESAPPTGRAAGAGEGIGVSLMGEKCISEGYFKEFYPLFWSLIIISPLLSDPGGG